MPGKMARSDPRSSVRVTRGAGSGQHLASELQEGWENANIDAGLGFSGESRNKMKKIPLPAPLHRLRLAFPTRNLSVAEKRHIQSIHETSELRNPDILVRYFLPPMRRFRSAWLDQKTLAMLRSDPFYYYLLARTKYYDGVFLDAISDNMKCIINVGCGSDTRSHRFEHVLKQKGVKVLECDQREAISGKQRIANRRWTFDYVAYLAIDLNDDAWPDFEHCLGTNNTPKTLVLMEGVSPYVNVGSFGRFLNLLARKLPAGSRVAYDFKLRGVRDDFGRVGRTQRPFRLALEEVGAYHKELGFRLGHMESSSHLSARLLTGVKSGVPLFTEDALIQLEVDALKRI
jgi:methyltransferase (TIGR00027 family)